VCIIASFFNFSHQKEMNNSKRIVESTSKTSTERGNNSNALATVTAVGNNKCENSDDDDDDMALKIKRLLWEVALGVFKKNRTPKLTQK
jgi:hypothetical protein